MEEAELRGGQLICRRANPEGGGGGEEEEAGRRSGKFAFQNFEGKMAFALK